MSTLKQLQTSAPTPQEVVDELNKHIIGQDSAKRAVAVALRNRWRRSQLDPELRDEITPKNILMIGPTGVGKTEIARRLAKFANAPFIKVEATKFTEVGYVGRDVESIVRDLADNAANTIREQELDACHAQAELLAIERVLDALLPGGDHLPEGDHQEVAETDEIPEQTTRTTRDRFREMLRTGKLHEREIDIEVGISPVGVQIMTPPGMEEFSSQLQNMFQNLHSGRTRKRRLKVQEALKLIAEEEAEKLVDEDSLKGKVVTTVEQYGIVFLDEIDKISRRSEEARHGADVSREGVQRDLLPLIEGSTVPTKYGAIRTDYILFIASGAFHLAKPSDLIPELQGRLPIRVELAPLGVNDFVRILLEPRASLTEQYRALLSTEKIDLQFTEDGINQVAEIAWKINEETENIGARRLHTVLEKLLEEISYTASEKSGSAIQVDKEYVDQRLKNIARDPDLSRYIL